jgi:hypothetical protein
LPILYLSVTRTFRRRSHLWICFVPPAPADSGNKATDIANPSDLSLAYSTYVSNSNLPPAILCNMSLWIYFVPPAPTDSGNKATNIVNPSDLSLSYSVFVSNLNLPLAILCTMSLWICFVPPAPADSGNKATNIANPWDLSLAYSSLYIAFTLMLNPKPSSSHSYLVVPVLSINILYRVRGYVGPPLKQVPEQINRGGRWPNVPRNA